MAYKLSDLSLVLSDSRITSMFGGSSKYIINDGALEDIKEMKNKNGSARKKKVLNKKGSKLEQTESNCKEERKKTYKLNKSKVKKKCHVFSRLEKSKKFMAFYSISFPKGLPDENAYKIFNTWLTRCRRDCGLKSYLWVAERQGNGTIHFHLLTNDYMQISQVNGYMAKCLSTEKKNGLEMLKDIEIEKYNGIDVKKVGGDRNKLINYLAKYVTKNEIEFYRLPWHCSRDVSRLFTTINYEGDQADLYFDQLPESSIHYHMKEEKYYTSAGFKFQPNEKMYSDLDAVNESIYNKK